MMTLGLIVSLILIILSLANVVYSIFAVWKIFNPKFKKYYIAASVVYCTGTLFIAGINLYNHTISFVFTIIAEIIILSVYIADMFFINKIGNSIDDLRKASEETMEKENEEANKEDKENP